MVTYYLTENTLIPATGDYCAVVTRRESTEGDAYIKQAAATLNISEGEIIGILNGLAASADMFIRQGRGFTLPGFGRFSFGIHGAFAGPDAPWDPKVQTMAVNFRVNRALTAAAQEAPKTRIHGITYGPVIDAVVDMTGNAVNTTLHPGGNTKITGKNIKIVGAKESAGITFIGKDGRIIPVDPAAVSHNGPTELVFICPSLPPGVYQVRIKTQYATGKHTMKTPRTSAFDTELTVS